jgi:hypothetical protein
MLTWLGQGQLYFTVRTSPRNFRLLLLLMMMVILVMEEEVVVVVVVINFKPPNLYPDRRNVTSTLK